MGQTLTAGTSGIADAEGLTNVAYTYQWLADDTEITDAAAYTLVDDDEGKKIKVKVSFSDDEGNAEERTSAETATVAAAPNTPATGDPTITGMAQVGQTLTADTSAIADDEGLTNVAYAYQWLADDTGITDATTSSYTLTETEESKAIKVRVSFTDDASNPETLTSAATAAVAAAIPGAPDGLTVSVNDTGKLDLSWDAPGSDGGSAITGYKVQWKETADSWDTAADVSEATATGTTYTVSGLTDGTEYTFRVTAVNSVGDSDASGEATGTPRETTAPTVSSAAVDGSTLTLTFSENLDVGVTPSSTAFTVNVNEAERNIFIVGLGGSNVLLTLSTAVESGDTVTVDYAKPSGANVIKDTDGNEADSFTGQAVTNNTAAPVTENSDPVQTPGSLTVNRHESGKLSASWDAPGTGPTPTGYTVQWKESGDDWATAADVSESDVTGTSHTIAGLTDGTEYAVRAMSRNGNDDSDPSAEVTATPQETVPPAPSSAAVDGTTLAITFSEALDTGQTPGTSAFGVSVAGSRRGVESVSVSGSAVTLTLVTAVSSGETVTVDYTAPTGESDARVQDLVGNAATSFTGQAVTNNTAPAAPPNSQATGKPEIAGTAQVGKTLTASTSDISDADGLSNVSYTYQWIANDGTSDSNIPNATSSTYTPVAADVGRTIKVTVAFTDDAGHDESLTSTSTASVAATVPGSAEGLAVSVNDTGKLDLSWDAPDGDGGSAITGYKVQWKEASDSWDTPVDVSETTVTGTSHTVSGLTDGVEYTFRIVAVNSVGDSTPSTEGRGTPRETTPPTVSAASVDGATLTITFSEALDTAEVPDKSAFTVSVAGSSRGVDTAAVSGNVVTLTLASTVSSEDAVTVDYTAPTGESAARLQDLLGNAAASFTGQAVTNNTTAAVRLTASVSAAPGSHDGSGTFTFELRFSEEPHDDFSYTTMKDHAFTVTGGRVTKSNRLNPPSNIGWLVHVTPDGDGTVTVLLPVTTDCAAQGAICTEDGRMLSSQLEITVPGPGG